MNKYVNIFEVFRKFIHFCEPRRPLWAIPFGQQLCRYIIFPSGFHLTCIMLCVQKLFGPLLPGESQTCTVYSVGENINYQQPTIVGLLQFFGLLFGSVYR